MDKRQDASLSKEANGSAEKLKSPNAVPDASSISAFMAQVSDLVKLVKVNFLVLYYFYFTENYYGWSIKFFLCLLGW